MVELGPLLHFFGKMLDVRYKYMYIVNSTLVDSVISTGPQRFN